MFYLFSRLLKYSDKSCHRRGTEQDLGQGGLGRRKAPTPAASLSPRSSVLTN